MKYDQQGLRPFLNHIPEHLHRPPSRNYVKERDGDAFCGRDYLDCSLGQNPFGCPQACLDLWNTDPEIFLVQYPGYPYEAERQALAEYWEPYVALDRQDIRLGTGSIGILNTLNKMWIQKGTRALGVVPQFPDFARNVQSYGGNFQGLPLKEEEGFAFHGERFLEKMGRGEQVIYLDNPNNPTGQQIPLEMLDAIAKKAAILGSIFVVDEAYGDFLPEQESAVALTRKYPNVLVVRSFSKGFGLAGLRLGYLISSPGWTFYYDRVDIPFTAHFLGQKLMSRALSNSSHLRASANAVAENKKRLLDRCRIFQVAHTDLRVPVTLLTHPDPGTHLWTKFHEQGVLTVSGEDFPGLDARSVRIVIPKNPERLWAAVDAINADTP